MTPRLSSADAPDNVETGFRGVLRDRTFLGLFLAEAQSAIGDQLARVALAILVFRSTGSVLATAGVYAATLLPAVLGGAILGRLGDRYSRRALMVGVDIVRAGAFVVMGTVPMPVPAVVALVVVAVTLGPVFSAAQVSTLAARLSPEGFRAANSLRLAASQVTQVAGFLLGGLIVAWAGPKPSLLIDGVTFAASAMLVLAATRRRGRRAVATKTSHTSTASAAVQAAASGPEGAHSTPTFAGLRRDPRLLRLVVLTVLSGLFVVPEGLAVPYGQSTGAATAQIGALFAAGAAGGAIGALLIVGMRRVLVREQLCALLAVLCGLPLIATVLTPGWPLAAALWFASGVFSAYMVDAVTLIVQAIPDSRRAGLVGVLSSLVLASQGVALLVMAALAQWTSPALAIAVAGMLGSVVAAVVLVRGRRPSAHSNVGGDPYARRRMIIESPGIRQTTSTPRQVAIPEGM